MKNCIRLFAVCWLPIVLGASAADVPPPKPSPTSEVGSVACFAAREVDYHKPGKPQLLLKFAEPTIISVASKPEKWGWYQFPNISRGTDGALKASWSMRADSITAYGKPGLGTAVSHDNGKTWTTTQGEAEALQGLLLTNGDRIAIATPEAIKVAELKLPEPVGRSEETYAKTNMMLYRLSDMPESRQGVFLKRMEKEQKFWSQEHATLEDPQALRYSFNGLVPVVWWGDLRLAKDGSVFAGIYPGYRLLDNGKADPHGGVFFYRSVDNGHSWKIQGRVGYQPDLAKDPKGNKRMGFTEPAFEILPKGTFLCVMRTSDGVGLGPMYASRSRDQGKTWDRPEVIAENGVLPKLLRLENGVTVLSSGRPGVQVRFSTDPDAKIWSDPFEMLPYEGKKGDVSCGYTDLVASGPDRFFIIYSDFKHPNAAGEPRKAVKVREVIVASK